MSRHTFCLALFALCLAAVPQAWAQGPSIFRLDDAIGERLLAAARQGAPAGATVRLVYHDDDLKNLSSRVKGVTFGSDFFAAPAVPLVLMRAIGSNSGGSVLARSVQTDFSIASSFGARLTHGVNTAVGRYYAMSFPGNMTVGGNSKFNFDIANLVTGISDAYRIWKVNDSLEVQPKKKFTLTYFVNQTTNAVPFTMVLEFRGRVKSDYAWDITGQPSKYGDRASQIGDLFKTAPDPNVTVISSDVVELSVEGIFSGVLGEAGYFELVVTDLP